MRRPILSMTSQLRRRSTIRIPPQASRRRTTTWPLARWNSCSRQRSADAYYAMWTSTPTTTSPSAKAGPPHVGKPVGICFILSTACSVPTMTMTPTDRSPTRSRSCARATLFGPHARKSLAGLLIPLPSPCRYRPVALQRYAVSSLVFLAIYGAPRDANGTSSSASSAALPPFCPAAWGCFPYCRRP